MPNPPTQTRLELERNLSANRKLLAKLQKLYAEADSGSWQKKNYAYDIRIVCALVYGYEAQLAEERTQ